MSAFLQNPLSALPKVEQLKPNTMKLWNKGLETANEGLTSRAENRVQIRSFSGCRRLPQLQDALHRERIRNESRFKSTSISSERIYTVGNY